MSYNNKYEEPWSENIELYFQGLLEDARKHSKMNSEAGYHCRKKRIIWGLPGILIPVVMSPIVVMVGMATNDDCSKITASDYLSSLSLLMSGIFVGVSNYFNYGEKTSKHFAVSLLYDMITSEVTLELAKKRNFRVPADVFMVKVNQMLSSAAREEPVIPLEVLRKNNTSTEEIIKKRTKLTEEFSQLSTPKSRSEENDSAMFESPPESTSNNRSPEINTVVHVHD